MALLYSNENVPLPIVVELRTLGHNVLTSIEAGNANRSIPDEQVLQFSTSQERILLTLNRLHFIRLHSVMPNHAGIIVCTYDADFRALAHRIHDVLVELGEMKGKLIRVNRPG